MVGKFATERRKHQTFGCLADNTNYTLLINFDGLVVFAVLGSAKIVLSSHSLLDPKPPTVLSTSRKFGMFILIMK